MDKDRFWDIVSFFFFLIEIYLDLKIEIDINKYNNSLHRNISDRFLIFKIL